MSVCSAWIQSPDCWRSSLIIKSLRESGVSCDDEVTELGFAWFSAQRKVIRDNWHSLNGGSSHNRVGLIVHYSHCFSLSAHLNNKPDRCGNRWWTGTLVWRFLRENMFDGWCQTLCTPSVLGVTLTLWLFCLEDIFLSECFCLSECRILKMTIDCVTARLLSLLFVAAVCVKISTFIIQVIRIWVVLSVKWFTAYFKIFSNFSFIEEETWPLRSFKKYVYCQICALNNSYSD